MSAASGSRRQGWRRSKVDRVQTVAIAARSPMSGFRPLGTRRRGRRYIRACSSRSCLTRPRPLVRYSSRRAGASTSDLGAVVWPRVCCSRRGQMPSPPQMHHLSVPQRRALELLARAPHRVESVDERYFAWILASTAPAESASFAPAGPGQNTLSNRENKNAVGGAERTASHGRSIWRMCKERRVAFHRTPHLNGRQRLL